LKLNQSNTRRKSRIEKEENLLNSAFLILHSEKLYPKAAKVYAMHERGAILQENRGATVKRNAKA
jgi:hypothetical protein